MEDLHVLGLLLKSTNLLVFRGLQEFGAWGFGLRVSVWCLVVHLTGHMHSSWGLRTLAQKMLTFSIIVGLY